MSRKAATTDSVFSEPQFAGTGETRSTPEEAPLESVWMEPVSGTHAKGAQLYGTWLARQQSIHSTAGTWVRTFAYCLFAGPLAILSAFFIKTPGSGILLYTVAGPLIEEIGKILIPLMIMEKNPAKYRYGIQLILTAVAGGLVFAVIENLIYLHVYFPEAGPVLAQWRWTVCVGLHTGCSFLAGWGLAKSWKESLRTLRPPQLETLAPFLIAAVGIHGIYNLLAVFLNPLFN